MRQVYGFFCDYAAPGNQGKPTVVGIFDAVFVRRTSTDVPIVTPPCFLHLFLECSAAFGRQHTLCCRMVDPDGNAVHETTLPIHFGERPVGMGLFAFVYIYVAPLAVSGFGTYEWVTYIDGQRIGEIPVSIVDGKLITAT